MRVWRIARERFLETAYTGEGAWLYAGRWNPIRTRMVYTSTSLALAAVELFVNLEPRDAPEDLVAVSATWLDGEVSIETVPVEALPPDWRALEHRELRAMGAAWITARRFAAWMVPSAAVEGEWNVLLNPAHPDFAKITLAEPRSFRFDPRMFKHAGHDLKLPPP